MIEKYGEITNRIKQLRKQKGINQREMAALLNVTPGYYGQLELRDTKLSIDQVNKIAKCLKVEPEEILTSNENYRFSSFYIDLYKLTMKYWLSDISERLFQIFEDRVSGGILELSKPQFVVVTRLIVELWKKQIQPYEESYYEFMKILANMYFKNITEIVYARTQNNIHINIIADENGLHVTEGFSRKLTMDQIIDPPPADSKSTFDSENETTDENHNLKKK